MSRADAREYSLYLVRAARGELYTGITTDVARRFREHERGSRGARRLRGQGPLELVYSEAIGDRSLASRIEYRVKRLSRADKETLVAGDVSLADLFPGLCRDLPQASGADSG